jgi:hypothetical protein
MEPFETIESIGFVIMLLLIAGFLISLANKTSESDESD